MPTTARSRLVFRLLEDGITDPFHHFAVEEALLRGVDQGTSPNTLRLRRSVPSVWIGVYQEAMEDVDVDHCRRHGIPIVRRYNPGGAVYQDEGSFCFSLFFRQVPFFEHLGIAEPLELYPLVAEAVALTCADYGQKVSFSPTNDCTIAGRKVYGSAQVKWGEAFVHSGTFLVATDCAVMDRVLRPSRLKFADKGFNSVRERVITLSEAVGRPIPVQEVMHKLARHLARQLRLELEPGELLAGEQAVSQGLLENKYSRAEWTFPTRPTYRSVLSTKAQSGVVTLAADLQDGLLRAVEVRGDFLAPDQAELACLLASIRGLSPTAAVTPVAESQLPADVREALVRLLKELAAGDAG